MNNLGRFVFKRKKVKDALYVGSFILKRGEVVGVVDIAVNNLWGVKDREADEILKTIENSVEVKELLAETMDRYFEAKSILRDVFVNSKTSEKIKKRILALNL